MRKNYGSGKVQNRPAETLCWKTIFESPTGDMRLVGHRRRRLVSAIAILALTPVIVGVLYASAATREGAGVTAVSPAAQKASAAEPLSYTEEATYLSVIPFETVTVSDPELLLGETRVVVEGRDGVREITEMRVYEDADTYRVSSVSSTIVVEAIAETIAIGTAEPPSTDSTGTYIWPAEGVVSSWFGKRSIDVGSSNHEGIDIAGSRGDSVYAADGGEVVLADDSVRGYGLMIKLLHDNGEMTYYAHCDELLVKEGERVYQGQEIAKMGSTGLSSGVHLHFEIRKNGSAVNPTKYLP